MIAVCANVDSDKEAGNFYFKGTPEFSSGESEAYVKKSSVILDRMFIGMFCPNLLILLRGKEPQNCSIF